MKLILSAVLVGILVVLSGGLYLSLRNQEHRQSDWQNVAAIPGKLMLRAADFGDYLGKLFTSKKPATTEPVAA